MPDGRVTFRLCAPAAQEVRVTSNDIAEAIPMGLQPGTTRGLAMTKDATGLWTATTAVPVPADTYRFNFQVDGARGQGAADDRGHAVRAHARPAQRERGVAISSPTAPSATT